MFSLAGKIARVTGASRALGWAVGSSAGFLAFDEAAYVNGHVLAVDGGSSAAM